MRRPIASRDTNWARQIAKALAGRGVTPNLVSASSVVFAALAALCLVMAARVDSKGIEIALFIGAALCIQFRLLCNLFDGMLAVEFGKASALGPIWNDFPDRPADVLILVGCGYSGGPEWMPIVGWSAAALALLTAYTRVLGAAIGGGEYFTGPMAKQQRMAVATISCVLAAIEVGLDRPHYVM
ncbi:CDP-alcohol phosphatidyltransferase family protein, partial [bacterium]